jgi:hypothetical protein
MNYCLTLIEDRKSRLLHAELTNQRSGACWPVESFSPRGETHIGLRIMRGRRMITRTLPFEPIKVKQFR